MSDKPSTLPAVKWLHQLADGYGFSDHIMPLELIKVRERLHGIASDYERMRALLDRWRCGGQCSLPGQILEQETNWLLTALQKGPQ